MTNATFLAIDASCAEGFAALVKSDQLPVTSDKKEDPALGKSSESEQLVTFSGGRARDCAAAKAIATLCEKYPEASIDAVVVGIGPGSYNGLRSSLAAAWGFTFARNIPLAGVSSWLALAEGDFAVAGDARQNQIALARVSSGAFVVAPRIVSREEALQEIAVLDTSLSLLCPALCGFPGERQCTPQPHLLVRVALAQGITTFPPVSSIIPEPIYLKPPHVTCARGV